MKLDLLESLPIAYHKYYGRLFHSKRDLDHKRLDSFVHTRAIRQNLLQSLQVNYPSNLPITASITELKELITNNQVIVVAAETGSGKTTQLPKILIEMGLCDYGIIGHTQPRRIAAKSIAARLTEELANTSVVGSKIRFSDKTSEHNLIKVMTDGVLLQEIQRDKLLLQYQVLIIDEAHERSLNIDFILGYLKQILPLRPDLKIIITSATLDNLGFSKFFDNAAIVEISGKTYPVDVLYQELDDEDSLELGIYKAIEGCFSIELGSVLVFLPGEREIKNVEKYLNKTSLKRFHILPLYSRQQDSSQQLVFKNDGLVKIILATNVAETSLTIPAIKFVIDPGLAKVKRYNARTKLEQLFVENIAKSNAKQRTGRAGRTSHGMCVRLYSETVYDGLKDFADPEILRSNLSNVILQLLYLKLGDPFLFPFITKPEDRVINDGYRSLTLLGAIDSQLSLTNIGYKMAKLPLDANLARIIIEGSKNSCIDDVLIIACYLSIQEPKESPLEFQSLAKQAHQQFADPKSDFVAILNLWQWWQEHVKHKKTNKQLLELCRKSFLSLPRLKEWRELYLQMKQVCIELDLYKQHTTDDQVGSNYNVLHNSIFSGFLLDIGIKDPSYNHYNSTNSRKILLHPSSLITPPSAFVSANIIQTSNTYARINAAIDIKEIAPLVKDFCKFNYSDAAWSKKRGRVVATRNWVFYGLKVNSDTVDYSLIDKAIARDLFIRQALVEGDINTTYQFLKHNQQVIIAIEKIEDKLRTSLANLDDILYEFYSDNLVDREVLDIPTLESWLKTNPDRLKLDKDKFIASLIDVKQTEELYPRMLRFDKLQFNVDYVFDHDRDDDGMSVKIELKYLNQIIPAWFSYLCLGLIRDKVTLLLKNIPKNYRVKLQPINETVNEFLYSETDKKLSLEENLTKYVIARLRIDSIDLDVIELPTYLKCHFIITDNGKVIGKGDDLIAIKHNLRDTLAKAFANISESVTEEITDYTDELRGITNSLTLADGKSIAYNALSVDKGKIYLVLVDNQTIAINLTKIAYIKLVTTSMLDLTKLINLSRDKTVSNFALCLLDIYTLAGLSHDLFNLLIRSSIDLSTFPQSHDEYLLLIKNSRQQLSASKGRLNKLLDSIVLEYKKVVNLLENHPLQDEITENLEQLFYSEFIQYINLNVLENYVRYLQAISIRLERFGKNRDKDRQYSQEIYSLYDRLDALISKYEVKSGSVPQLLYDFYYRIEELKISLFAPSIKTLYVVSPKRLNEELNKYV